MTSQETLYAAVLAADEEPERAARMARLAADRDPGSLLARHLAEALTERPGTDGVYTDPEAFEAFISGGTNPQLYSATAAALADVYSRHRPMRLLDIGVGDGRALHAALELSSHRPSLIEVVEPSPGLADHAAARDWPVPLTSHVTTLQDFVGQASPDLGWDLVQATYSFHSIPPDDRPTVLRWLAGRTERLVIVEFDVPDFADDRGLDRFTHCAERFEVGLAEYADTPSVAQGFLIPVFMGWFTNTPRTTWEGSTATWRSTISAAGFSVETVPVSDYWWAPAVAHLATVAHP